VIVDSSVWIAHLRGARDVSAFLQLERALLTFPRFVPANPRQLVRNAAQRQQLPDRLLRDRGRRTAVA
jgi:predicted nucleic acid-binding protein